MANLDWEWHTAALAGRWERTVLPHKHWRTIDGCRYHVRRKRLSSGYSTCSFPGVYRDGRRDLLRPEELRRKPGRATVSDPIAGRNRRTAHCPYKLDGRSQEVAFVS